MKKLGHIAAAVVLAAGFIYLVTAQKDDAQMADFKSKAAVFVRDGGKLYAPLSDVLGRGGDKICIKFDDKDGMEITIQDYKVLTVMNGRRDVVIDGKGYTFFANDSCYDFASVKLAKVLEENHINPDTRYLVFDYMKNMSGRKPNVENKKAEKPKAQKKPTPAPEKKKPAPRNYGY